MSSDRLQQFQTILDEHADLAFFPISSDLQYLTGVPRDFPNYGHTIHPGDWLQGAWITPQRPPVLPLPRMTAEFGGLSRLQGLDIRVLGDWDAPSTMLRGILDDFDLPDNPRVAISDFATGETVSQLQKLLPGVVWLSATALLRPMRVLKSPADIELMKQAGRITEAAFADTLAQMRHGMTELQIVEEVNYQLRKHGSLGQSFTTSLYNSAPSLPLIFGDRMKSWPRKLEPPVSILFDFGGIYEGWCYDFGRTVFFGEPPPESQRVYDLVMASQAAGIAALRADAATTSDADRAARDVIESAGYGEAFRHRLGHGIGMDVHEPPFLTRGDETPLQDGMLFTIEPSIMQLNDYSARVEDVVVARAGGGEKLTNGWQELVVIE
ncbi:MAG: Xaa-Pro peptidase family protein [Chloroflexi bacterium]|nr:Xaa-Pro peptidase family protein [Chloroflexota bacterium]MCY3714968.1 Xaa-Pro peptidase family protein [Chloroflexota bacterium]